MREGTRKVKGTLGVSVRGGREGEESKRLSKFERGTGEYCHDRGRGRIPQKKRKYGTPGIDDRRFKKCIFTAATLMTRNQAEPQA